LTRPKGARQTLARWNGPKTVGGGPPRTKGDKTDPWKYRKSAFITKYGEKLRHGEFAHKGKGDTGVTRDRSCKLKRKKHCGGAFEHSGKRGLSSGEARKEN